MSATAVAASNTMPPAASICRNRTAGCIARASLRSLWRNVGRALARGLLVMACRSIRYADQTSRHTGDHDGTAGAGEGAYAETLRPAPAALADLDPPAAEGVDMPPAARDVEQFDATDRARKRRIDHEVVAVRFEPQHRR